MTMFKHYIPRAILITVHFTGTNFVRKLLDHAPHAYIPVVHWSDKEVEEEWDKITKRKIIVTARDPYLCGIRYTKGSTVEAAAKEWDIMLDRLSEIDHFVFDVACSDRRAHVNDLFNFINEVPHFDTEKFVNDWTPIKASRSPLKEEYLESGKLPEGHDWSQLDRAVNWYNSLTTRD